MIQKVFPLAIILLCGHIVIAQKTESKKVKVSLASGLQQEDFNWSISGNLQGENPNVYSELRWEDLKSFGVSLDVMITIRKQVYVNLDASKHFIFSGSATDIDYRQDNREEPSFSAVLKSDEGAVASLSGTVGYSILKTRICRITPYLGFKVLEQSLLLLDDDLYSGGQLNSTYDTRWNGIIAKIQIDIFLTKDLLLSPSLNYSQTNYSGKANWNLIPAFQHPVSFRHKAKGYRLEPELQIESRINSLLSVYIKGIFNYSSTGFGIDYLYLSTGETVKTRLNDVSRIGYGLRLGLSCSF